MTDVTGGLGETKVSYVFLQTSVPVQGWTLGICHNNTNASLIDIADGTALLALNGGLGADFVSTTNVTDGWIGSVIVDVMSIMTLPPAIGLIEIHSAMYTIVGPGAPGICFCDTLGNPQVSQVLLSGGLSHTPTLQCAPEIGNNTPFRRGDSNADGSVGLADVVRILGFLFSQALPPDCLDAADINDDSTIDISDTIYLLTYLFQFGAPAPPAPGPFSCGVDTQLDLFDECQYNSC
ncbi:MAG: hypothetical protein AAF581_09790 [Planctomycetota bacterium]